ncbi:RraA family protein [Halopenitus sp. H-Gu1]|uniref:RraA family protein n=1 Tax=Halopenitus sp. H-Gu1 TaxID=3242697 RepID=UPI00359E0EB1
MPTRTDPVNETLLDGFRELSTPVVADTKHQGVAVLSGSIEAIHAGCSVVGAARTTRVDPSAIWPPVETLVDADAGDVIVIDAGGCIEEAVWGELLSTYAETIGVAGMVTDGAVRDISEIRDLGFPVFAPARTPRGPSGSAEIERDVPIALGETVIEPGDIVMGDESGVAVIDRNAAEEILADAREIEETERAVRRHIDDGKSLEEAFEHAGM